MKSWKMLLEGQIVGVGELSYLIELEMNVDRTRKEMNAHPL